MQVRPAPHNIRLEVGDVTELADSIKGQGIIQPLTVGPHPDLEGDYILIAGHRRLAAAKKAGLDTVPCVINRTLNTKAAQVQAMLVENLQRADITPVEEAAAYQYLLDLPDYTVQSIAKDTGRSQKTVRERVKLNKLTESVKEGIDRGQVTLERALVLAEYADDADATAALEKVITGGTPNSWEYEVKRQEKRRDWRQRMPQVREELTAAGVTIIDRPEGREHEWPVQMIYTPADLTYAQRAELGHQAIVDEASGAEPYYSEKGILWVRDRPAATAPREPSPEELEAEQRRADLAQGLILMAEVRDEYLKATIKAPTDDQAKAALIELIFGALYTHPGVGLEVIIAAADLTYDLTEGADDDGVLQDIARLLATLPVARLALVLHYIKSERETDLRQLSYWGNNTYYARQTAAWIRSLSNVYGYELSDIEKQAIAWNAPKPENPVDAD